ncbi:PREDICTED: dapper homolog 1 [Poecilia mexicana]|uniref:Dishevelled binding antagonist of beta catenin 1 n=1 Tax=Poecilia mexicana TaxID=48701 RepID=A0A3B3YHV5_9TELE|nr:PREDICTED: dapper homolog 1 [Poecilia mexicana]
MPLFAASRREGDGRCGRHRAPSDGERLRSVRERLELMVSVLGELEYLRHRQQLLVLSALKEEVKEARCDAQLSCEENILVLRKQLSCLRRDAGVISELHELDQQINELRLEPELAHDQLETDSRPSSGFYELSDGASGSLSNSSHSVFSECFCSTADAEGYFLSSEELASCLEYDVLVGGFYDDLGSSGVVRRSLSAPHQASLEATSLAPTDSPSKTLCSFFPRNVSDIYNYRSPSHAAAVQGSVLLQVSGDGGQCRDEAGGECLKTQTSPILGSVSGSLRLQGSTFQTHSSKHLEKYIFGLLQRRAQPIRVNRPRTNISTDPLKSVVRQPSLCLRQASGPFSGAGTLKGSEIKSVFPAGETSAEVITISSSPRQSSLESKNEEKGTQRASPDDTDIMQISSKINKGDSNSNLQNNCSVTSRVKNTSTKRLISKTGKGSLSLSGASVPTLLTDNTVQRSPKCNSSDKETSQPCCPVDQEQIIKSVLTAKTQTAASKKLSKPLQSGPSEDKSELVHSSAEPFAQNHKEDIRVVRRSHVGNGNLAKQHNGKHRKGNSRNVKITKVKSTNRTSTMLASERKEVPSEKKDKFCLIPNRVLPVDDGRSNHVKVSNKGTSSGLKNISASTLLAGVPDKPPRSTQISVRSGVLKQHHHGNHHSHHPHGCEQFIVVAKPKYKRNDYRPLRAIMEVPCDGVNKHGQWRQRKKVLRNSAAKTYPTSGGQQCSQYSNVAGSDSEYSAECVSLFHSTIVDTSEDDRSNYTTNCFGDSESSEEEYVEENTTTTDTEESVGGGPGGGGSSGTGRHRGQLRTARVTVGKLEMDPAQTKTFVKIKASYNLKRKILRFRSGSLKLMTTV